jgi:hypothetical protein
VLDTFIAYTTNEINAGLSSLLKATTSEIRLERAGYAVSSWADSA